MGSASCTRKVWLGASMSLSTSVTFALTAASLGQLRLDAGRRPRGDLAVVGRRHHHLDLERIDLGHAEQRLVFHPLAHRHIALGHHPVEGAADAALRQLRRGQPQLALGDPLLLLRLRQLLFGHLELGAHLIEPLLGDEFLAQQILGALQLLAREAHVGAGGLLVGLGLGAAAGHAHGGALDLGAQQRQNLALHYPVAALDQQLLHHPDHRRAHLGHLLRLDQTAQRLGTENHADTGGHPDGQ